MVFEHGKCRTVGESPPFLCVLVLFSWGKGHFSESVLAAHRWDLDRETLGRRERQSPIASNDCLGGLKGDWKTEEELKFKTVY